VQPFSLSFPLTSKHRRRSFKFILVFSFNVAAESYLVDVCVLCFVFFVFIVLLLLLLCFMCLVASPAFLSVVILCSRRSVSRLVC